MAKIPRNYIVRGGGDWLDIDYSNIDFDHAGVTLRPGLTTATWCMQTRRRPPASSVRAT